MYTVRRPLRGPIYSSSWLATWGSAASAALVVRSRHPPRRPCCQRGRPHPVLQHRPLLSDARRAAEGTLRTTGRRGLDDLGEEAFQRAPSTLGTTLRAIPGLSLPSGGVRSWGCQGPGEWFRGWWKPVETPILEAPSGRRLNEPSDFCSKTARSPVEPCATWRSNSSRPPMRFPSALALLLFSSSCDGQPGSP